MLFPANPTLMWDTRFNQTHILYLFHENGSSSAFRVQYVTVYVNYVVTGLSPRTESSVDFSLAACLRFNSVVLLVPIWSLFQFPWVNLPKGLVKLSIYISFFSFLGAISSCLWLCVLSGLDSNWLLAQQRRGEPDRTSFLRPELVLCTGTTWVEKGLLGSFE